MNELRAVLKALEPEFWDLGDGCEMCVKHSLDIINKAIEPYGFHYTIINKGEKYDEDIEVILVETNK